MTKKIEKDYNDHELSGLMELIRRKIKIFREEQAISQKELAERSGIGLSTINDLEKAVTNDIRLSTVTAIARVLNRKTIDFLIESDLNLSEQDRRTFERAVHDLYRIARKIG